MTAPGGSMGRGEIEFHADTKRVKPELEAALRQATQDADKILDKAGKDWGDTVSKSTATEIRKHGKDFSTAIEGSLKGRVISVRGARFKFDERGMLHDFDTGRFAGRLVSDTISSLNSAVLGQGGAFANIGTAISDAVGAGFNVSGQSPLIPLLTIAVTALIGLILAAVQAAGALVAVLFTIPSLLGSIALQVGIIVIAFQGVGEAIKAAFDAKNAEELREALQGLQPSARDFVLELFPLRDLFKELQKLIQESFFRGFNTNSVFDKLGVILEMLTRSKNFKDLVTQLGDFFGELAAFFGSQTFREFLTELMPSTTAFLKAFGPAMTAFLTGLIKFATDMLPFLDRVGQGFSRLFTEFGEFLSRVGNDPAFQGWLDDMWETLKSLGKVFDELIEFVITFLDVLNDAGGQQLLESLAEILDRLSFFLASPAGRMAMEALVEITIGAMEAITGLFIFFLLILTTLKVAFDEAKRRWDLLIEAFGDLIRWLDSIMHKLAAMRGGTSAVIGAIGKAFATLGKDIASVFTKAIPSIISKVNQLPGKLADIAWRAGTGLVSNLINGIRNRLPSLSDIAQQVANIISFVLPGSPAKEGPLSGEGYALFRGQHLVQDLAAGMQSQIPDLMTVANEIAGSIFNTNLNFFGQQPTETQARTLGRAVSAEMNQQIMQREVSLAVRAI